MASEKNTIMITTLSTGTAQGTEKEDEDEQSNAALGLSIDPSLPDAINYTGANFISLGNIVPPTAWKSLNKNDSFIFNSFYGFDGRVTTPASTTATTTAGNGFQIGANSSPSEPSVNIDSFKTDYKVKLILDEKDTLVLTTKLKFFIKIKGVVKRFGQRLEKETTEQQVGDLLEESFDLPGIDNVGEIIGVSLRVEPEDGSKPTLSDIRMVSIDIGRSEILTTIPVDSSIEDLLGEEGVYFEAPEPPISLPEDSPTENNELDGFGFYQKTYSSSNFEVTLKGFQIKSAPTSSVSAPSSTNTGAEQLRLAPPQFGLMVRDGFKDENSLKASNDSSNDEIFDSFCVLFEPSVTLNGAGSYKVCITVNGKKIGSGRPIRSIQDTDELKITRENGIFEGYYNDTLIGEKKIQSRVDRENAAVSTPSQTTLVNSFAIGIAYFAPPVLKLVGNLDILTSSSVSFAEASEVAVKDRNFIVKEVYNLSLYYGRYGVGRTVNTFTLLPGETTEIQLKTSIASTDRSTRTTTVFDKVSESAKQELEESIEEEQSSSTESSNSFSFNASVTAAYSGPVASASGTVGTDISESSSRASAARAVASAVSKQATEYSSERSVEASETTITDKLTEESNSNTRTLENLNNNRTLNFVFRQLNQEYISLLRLMDIRIAFVTAEGNGQQNAETDILSLKKFIGAYVQDDTEQKELLEKIYRNIIDNIRFVNDYNDDLIDVLVQKQIKAPKKRAFRTQDQSAVVTSSDPVTDTDNVDTEKFISFDNTLKFDYEITDGLSIRDIEGVIIRADEYVLRTDGIVTEAIVGDGDALDEYGLDLQTEDIKEKQANRKIVEAKADLLNLQKDIIKSADDDLRVKYLECLDDDLRVKFLEVLNPPESKELAPDTPCGGIKSDLYQDSFGLKFGAAMLVVAIISFDMLALGSKRGAH